jgi:hypothetical protein
MMNRSILSIVAVCAAAISTSGCFGDTLGIHYNVVIDSNFSDANKLYIRAAVQSWEDILGDNLDIISITEGSCSAGIIPTIGSLPPGNLEMPDPGTMREICFHPTTGDWINAHTDEQSVIGLTYRHAPEDSADIYMPVDRDSTLSPADWTETAAHEMGHAMGLFHTTTGIMFWELDNTPKPTCVDSSQYLTIRHMSDITPECPEGGSWSYYH